jgi:DNA invertase Pin-like site-specific DNA recombinase
MTAYAYLRKSVIHNGQHSDSQAVQEASVRSLAARHGDADVIILSDWDKSGRLGRDKRPGYGRLLDAIESGEAHAIYSYSLSRLARSVKELSDLFDLCGRAGVALRIDRDSLDTSTASGKMHAHVLAAVAQFESDVASERQRDRYAAKLARGEKIGTAKSYGERPGEDPEAVLRAFREGGSFSAASKLLNERGIKPRNGRAWWPSSVAVIVKRLDPKVGIRRPSRGYKAGGSDFTLARLLRCPTCGTRLTGTRDRVDGPNRGRVRYACRLGTSMPHPRISISEHLILPAIREEAEHLLTPEQVAMASDDSGQRAELEARRARIIDLYEAGHVTREEREQRLQAVSEALEKLDSRRIIRAVPGIDWDWPPRQLNAVLRAIFEDVQLDPATFEPVGYTWTVPEWRS